MTTIPPPPIDWITVDEAQYLLRQLPKNELSPYDITFGIDPNGGPLMVMLTMAENTNDR